MEPDLEEILQHSQLLLSDLPDSVLLHIFCYLPFSSICQVSQVCQRWNQVASDELLWRSVFLWHYKLPFSTNLPKKAVSWRAEFKRLFYYTPALQAEELKEHKDEVLHVSFSHDGTMFSTCSKDGYFKIWSAVSSPVRLLFKMDMRSSLNWDFTQFSQFNESDTYLLVSGVYLGRLTSSGEIAIFNLQDDFKMQSRVTNKPYDVFGTWYDNDHLLSGTFFTRDNRSSVSSIWLSKASQEVESEMESVSMVLYRFRNTNGSCVRFLNVAEVERAPIMLENGVESKETKSCCSGCVSASAGHEPSLLDQLLCKEISEEEFDVENEDWDCEDDDDDEDNDESERECDDGDDDGDGIGDDEEEMEMEKKTQQIACGRSLSKESPFEHGEARMQSEEAARAMECCVEEMNASDDKQYFNGSGQAGTENPCSTTAIDSQERSGFSRLRCGTQAFFKEEPEPHASNAGRVNPSSTADSTNNASPSLSSSSSFTSSCKACSCPGSAKFIPLEGKGEDGETKNERKDHFSQCSHFSAPNPSSSKYSSDSLPNPFSNDSLHARFLSIQRDHISNLDKEELNAHTNLGDSSNVVERQKQHVDCVGNSGNFLKEYPFRGDSESVTPSFLRESFLDPDNSLSTQGNELCSETNLCVSEKPLVNNGLSCSMDATSNSSEGASNSCDKVGVPRSENACLSLATGSQLGEVEVCSATASLRSDNQSEANDIFECEASSSPSDQDGTNYQLPPHSVRQRNLIDNKNGSKQPTCLSPTSISYSDSPFCDISDSSKLRECSAQNNIVGPVPSLSHSQPTTFKSSLSPIFLDLPASKSTQVHGNACDTAHERQACLKQKRKGRPGLHRRGVHQQKNVKYPPEKLLIYTWGSKAYAPHMIGFKRMKLTDSSKGEMTARRSSMLPSVTESLQNGLEPSRHDEPDHSIEMNGNIVGLRVTPDQRYLYVNCRPWPKHYIISDPLESPPPAQEVELSTIDLQTFEVVGPVLRSHKAYTDTDGCFFLFMDVSENYVVSGAEDKHGYLWDRHYGIPLYRFPHKSVVNCVAVNPKDPEMLVTVSDDHSIKVWRSRHKYTRPSASSTADLPTIPKNSGSSRFFVLIPKSRFTTP